MTKWTNPNPPFVVDGEDGDHEDSSLVYWEDAVCGPYRIFNTETQRYLPETYETPEAALAALEAVLAAIAIGG